MIDHTADAFDIGFHGNQHSSDVRMANNLSAGCIGIFEVAGVCALSSLLCVAEGAEVGSSAASESLDADAEAGFVHHLEHTGHAAMKLAEQPALAAAFFAKIHHAGRGAVDAHLFFDASTLDIVLFAEATVGIDEEFGDEEEADALCASGCAGCSGEDGVDDIVGGIVIAAGDEDLCALDEVVVILGGGHRGQRADIATCVGFGEAHGASPLACVHFFAVGFFHLFGAEGFDEMAGSVGE